MNIQSHDILSFWFGQWPFHAESSEKQSQLWFSGSDEMDALITKQFATQVKAALEKTLNTIETLNDSIAFIILTDQFTRNIYRKSPEAFSGDELALNETLKLIKDKQHIKLPVPVASFACMPLQHSEDKEMQKLSIDIFNEILLQAPPEFTEAAKGYADFAKLHADIILEFGRFPHRNPTLNRLSTQAEKTYMESGGHRFGQ